jgi:hypothetical protein
MNDYIMAAFQAGACAFLCLSIYTIFRDRELKGVSVWMIGYFTVWTVFGTWNWYSLGMFWSYVTSVLMGILYLMWLALAIAARFEQTMREPAVFLGVRQLVEFWRAR